MTPKRIFMLGATGTIGRATCAALIARGHQLVCFARGPKATDQNENYNPHWRYGDVTDVKALLRDGFRGEKFDVLLSCMASRTGDAKDAWAVDYQAHSNALECAQSAGVTHMVLLSAICVQKPLLAFQHAKLAFEDILINSGMDYSIVRPTAFFKSLSGQIERVQKGKPFLLFGDGNLTACKPISDGDLATFLAETVDRPDRRNCILPIGGPGQAITPREQGELLYSLLEKEPRYRHVPVAMMDAIISALNLVGRIVPSVTAKAELARIGRYYATESMLVWDPVMARYDADATPSTGSETLEDHYRKIIAGDRKVDLGDHAIF